jgi:hypothetical protein
MECIMQAFPTCALTESDLDLVVEDAGSGRAHPDARCFVVRRQQI